MVAALDPLRQLDLLSGGEEIDLADVLEEELERIRRDLARRLDRLLLFLLEGDDLDLQLLESVVEIVDLSRLEIELVERDGDLVGTQMPVLFPRLKKRFCVVRLQKVGDGPRWCCGYLGCAHSVPPSRTGVLAMPHCASCVGRAP